MKRGSKTRLILVSILALTVWTVAVLEIYQMFCVNPAFRQQELVLRSIASQEASRVVEARFQKLKKYYEDGQNDNTVYDSPEGLFWWMGYKQESLEDEQFRVFNAMEETFHRDKAFGARWVRVHMAIDNKPSWQPTDTTEPFMAYTEK